MAPVRARFSWRFFTHSVGFTLLLLVFSFVMSVLEVSYVFYLHTWMAFISLTQAALVLEYGGGDASLGITFLSLRDNDSPWISRFTFVTRVSEVFARLRRRRSS